MRGASGAAIGGPEPRNWRASDNALVDAAFIRRVGRRERDASQPCTAAREKIINVPMTALSADDVPPDPRGQPASRPSGVHVVPRRQAHTPQPSNQKLNPPCQVDVELVYAGGGPVFQRRLDLDCGACHARSVTRIERVGCSTASPYDTHDLEDSVVHIREFQVLIDKMYSDKDRERGPAKTFLWLTEEFGELARAVAKRNDRDNLREEFADVLAWLVTLANVEDIDLEDAIRKFTSGCPGCGQMTCRCDAKMT